MAPWAERPRDCRLPAPRSPRTGKAGDRCQSGRKKADEGARERLDGRGLRAPNASIRLEQGRNIRWRDSTERERNLRPGLSSSTIWEDAGGVAGLRNSRSGPARNVAFGRKKQWLGPAVADKVGFREAERAKRASMTTICRDQSVRWLANDFRRGLYNAGRRPR